jgi:hypothetical protein
MFTRKKLGSAALMAAGFGMAATSQAALAQWAPDHHRHHHLSVTTTALAVCVLSSPAAAGASINASYASNTITLTQLIDPTTASVNQASLTLQIANAICNNNAWLSLRSQNGGLTSSSASGVTSGSGGFLTVIPYTAAARWGGLNLTLDTSTGVNVAKVPTGGANSGSLSLGIATQKSALPVVQGTYSDVLTVKIGASF